MNDPPLEDYARLAQEVRSAGLLTRRPWSYVAKIGLTVICLAAAWGALFRVGNSWATLAVAAILAVVFTQVVFLGHDAGHQQIFASRLGNRLVGLGMGDLLTGISFGWWVPKHNAHHAYPNQLGRDPDIGVGIIAFDVPPEMQARRGALSQLVARRQAWLFFPFLLIQGLGLHISGFQAVWRRRDRAAFVELVLLLIHTALYLTAVFWVLPPVKAVSFVAVQQGIFGLYLGLAFAPNHKGMATIGAGREVGFARRQIVTARNIRGGWLTAVAFGGLNYQIEHHLFPMMPRFNLAKAQHFVEPFCRIHDLPYCQQTLIGSYRQILRHLAAKEASPAPIVS